MTHQYRFAPFGTESRGWKSSGTIRLTTDGFGKEDRGARAVILESFDLALASGSYKTDAVGAGSDRNGPTQNSRQRSRSAVVFSDDPQPGVHGVDSFRHNRVKGRLPALHRSLDSTTIYAKVDLPALTRVAPWNSTARQIKRWLHRAGPMRVRAVAVPKSHRRSSDDYNG